MFDGFRASIAIVVFGGVFKIGDVAAISDVGFIAAIVFAVFSLVFGYLCDYLSLKGGKNG